MQPVRGLTASEVTQMAPRTGIVSTSRRSSHGSKTKKRASLVVSARSEEHTSELQSPDHLVCRLLLEKKKPTSVYFYQQHHRHYYQLHKYYSTHTITSVMYPTYIDVHSMFSFWHATLVCRNDHCNTE